MTDRDLLRALAGVRWETGSYEYGVVANMDKTVFMHVRDHHSPRDIGMLVEDHQAELSEVAGFPVTLYAVRGGAIVAAKGPNAGTSSRLERIEDGYEAR